MSSLADPFVRDLMEKGHTFLPLAAQDIEHQSLLLQMADAFFDLPEAAKMRSASADFNSGYRPYGIEYSQTPDRPDLNQAFAFWIGIDPIPDPSNLQLLTAFERYQNVVQRLATDLLQRLSDAFEYRGSLSFAGASYLQVNRYDVAVRDREYLQDAHEDGHLFTLHYASHEGLEIKVDGQFVSAPQSAGSLLVIPGSVLTLMTGGLIAPLYHRVRAQSQKRRFAVMYFVNPPIGVDIEPFFETEINRGLSIRDHVASAPERFGLPNLYAAINQGSSDDAG